MIDIDASDRLPLSRRIYRGALAYSALLTAVWLFFVITKADGGTLFRNYEVSRQSLARVVTGFLIFWVFWSWLWYLLKRFLLRRVVGLDRAELQAVFASRLTGFDLPGLLARHSERRIRIVDMIGRRGRTIPAAVAGFVYLYIHISRHPGAESLALGIQDNVFDGLILAWFINLTYHSNGFLSRIAYGAHARIMDGALGRANALLITTMWTGFKFILIPLGLQLGRLFPPPTYAALFVFIWPSYLIADGMSEIVGSLFGKQRLRVWGVGDVNRKSVAGTWACFLTSLVICVSVVIATGLPPVWLALALVVSLSNTALELFSPRATDDLTMPVGNALLCWGFGALVL